MYGVFPVTRDGYEIWYEQYVEKSGEMVVEFHHQFLRTMRTDSSANVIEAIGYIPWYFQPAGYDRNMKLPGREILDEKVSLLTYSYSTDVVIQFHTREWVGV